jgi:predicted DNA-binding transcriptional regulator
LSKDQSLGAILLIGAIVGIIIYFWLVFLVDPLLILQLTAFIAVAGVLAIVAWIGYTMATTPPPEPIEFEEPPITPDVDAE